MSSLLCFKSRPASSAAATAAVETKAASSSSTGKRNSKSKNSEKPEARGDDEGVSVPLLHLAGPNVSVESETTTKNSKFEITQIFKVCVGYKASK
jgi:hypothetical protein